MKRVFDVFVAATSLALLLPFLLIIGIAIRVSSPGPALFRHERVGQDFSPFEVLKFRTMRSDSVGSQITSASDPRVTALGRILRQYKIDELPQLVNVLRGDMSIVGPRPEVARYVELHPEYKVVLSVQPGLTDPASLRYRHEQELLETQDDPETFYRSELLPDKIRLSVSYVESRSFVGDLKLIGKTIHAIIK